MFFLFDGKLLCDFANEILKEAEAGKTDN